ncbi:MAG: biotin carboxylase [Deltaproteobacteria bacterium]|nr:biotin carboxylase [Deltaproteobacteria bacterium]
MEKSKDNQKTDRKNKIPTTKNQEENEPVRADLAEVIERHALGLDERRPDVVAKRQQKNRRTARAYVHELFDPGSFIEYGALAVAAQRSRRTEEELFRRTPADGLIAGVGLINGTAFDEAKARSMVLAYDYSVLAGTQGFFNHKKMDRMLHLAYENRLPVILFAEGGGGRPGDIDKDLIRSTGLDLITFSAMGRLNGIVPLVGIVTGYCFAGNAVLLSCCDAIIATRNSNIGMAGPVMIEGGGLGVFAPEDVGPMDVQTQNGVVDIAVEDDREAVAVAKQYLSYFQGSSPQWEAPDQNRLRKIVPENRRRVYDVRAVIRGIADTDSFLELRPDFSPGIITGLIRIEGRAFGVIANNCKHQAGAIEAEGADKAVHHMQLCNAHGLPILCLCDTPGFMVGPEVERRAHVRHCGRMFVIGAHLKVPYFTIVLRRGYGLGAMAMAKGGFHDSFFTAAWPTGEFGGMGLEGAVKAGFRRELDAVEDPQERQALYDRLLADLYYRGKAVNVASRLEIDAVIDPAQTRQWLMRGLAYASARAGIAEAGHGMVDPW